MAVTMWTMTAATTTSILAAVARSDPRRSFTRLADARLAVAALAPTPRVPGWRLDLFAAASNLCASNRIRRAWTSFLATEERPGAQVYGRHAWDGHGGGGPAKIEPPLHESKGLCVRCDRGHILQVGQRGSPGPSPDHGRREREREFGGIASPRPRVASVSSNCPFDRVCGGQSGS
jgi:hypothetical protein